MNASDRLLKYVSYRTPSDETSETHPSSSCQFDLANALVEELKSLGVEDAYVDENCYVYGHIPASPGKEDRAAIGLIAHMDTVSDFCDHDVRPQIIENYDGNDIELEEGGIVIKVKDFPHLADLKGHTLITSDGTTILGADDKAGIAEIMTAVEQLDSIEHGPLCICFSPDEEIGGGTICFRIDEFGAKYAFTVDGESAGEVQFESFNAARAKIHITGKNVHPGFCKNIMINAALVGMEFNAMLPAGERPVNTEGYEGFYHLQSFNGDVSTADMDYLLRDHDASKLEAKKATMELAAKLLNEKYGANTVDLHIDDQYQNMGEVLKNYPEVISKAKDACKDCGVNPIVIPIRGSTDGSSLSFKGLPCPNLGTGGHAFHGPYEHISIQEMDKVVNILLSLIKNFAE